MTPLKTLDKRMDATAMVSRLQNGMTLGIGGWGPRRKPMALVREILRSDLTDLTIVSYGGPDVGMLCAAGKVKKLVFAFVSMDAIPLEPWFRKAREAGAISSAVSNAAISAEKLYKPKPEAVINKDKIITSIRRIRNSAYSEATYAAVKPRNSR